MARLIIPNIPRSAVIHMTTGITGTVNGISTVFVCDHFIYKRGTGDSVLVAYVADASSYTYNVKVNGTTYSGTIQHSDLMSFVYDRTQADVEAAIRLRAEGRARTTADLKGTLNNSDLVRNISNITKLCDIFGISKTVPDSVPEFPNKDNLFNHMSSDLQNLSYDGFVCHGLKFYSSSDVYNPPFNQWFTWNDIEECLFDNYDVITTRWEYFSGDYVMEFIDANLDINKHNLFIYQAGQKYKADISDVCRYIRIPALRRPQGTTSIYTFADALNTLYAKIMEDMDTLMLETSDGYVLATNTGKVIVAKEDD